MSGKDKAWNIITALLIITAASSSVIIITNISNVFISPLARLDLPRAIQEPRERRAAESGRAGTAEELIRSSFLGDLKTVEILLESGVSPDQGADGYFALPAAARAGQAKTAAALLEAAANPNVRDPLGRTALMYAAENGDERLLDILLELKASPNLQDREGWSALMEAARKGHKKCVVTLLKAGADPRIRNKLGHTARDAASVNGRAEIMTILP